jgi:hypothetical protein
MTNRLTTRRAIGAALLLAAGAVVFSAAPAYAVPPAGQICPDLDSGKIDVTGDVSEITITADEGFVITEVCVKAGSVQSGGGVTIITVDPPSQTFTFSAPSGKDISHYSFSVEPVSTPTPTPTPTPTETSSVILPPDSTSGGGGFDGGWMLIAGLGAFALGSAVVGERVAVKRRLVA